MNSRVKSIVYTNSRRIGVVIVAAGISQRMSGLDKIFLPLADKPVIAHTLQAFGNLPTVDAMALVVSDKNLTAGAQILSELGLSKRVAITIGGDRRQDSVRNGLVLLSECDIIIVHDGARPFVNADIVDRGLLAVEKTGAATAAVPIKDTIKEVDTLDMMVVSTLERTHLWAAQTPQVFGYRQLKNAHESISYDVTDDASMIECMGGTVKLFMGSYQNIKITTPEDVVMAEAIYVSRPPHEERTT